MPKFFKLPRTTAVALISLVMLVPGPRVWGHADLIEQIRALTAQIAAEPTNAALLLRRADLHRRHEEFAEAHADVDAAGKLQPDLADVWFMRAKVLWDEGKPAGTLDQLERVLRKEPAFAEGLAFRGRCRARQEQFAGAIADFSAAIKLYPDPSPDLWLERARAQAASGDLAAAVAGLDQGMQRLGPIPSLEMPAVEYELQRTNISGALVRMDRIIARYPVKEPWLASRGELLEQAGRFAEAREAFQQVLSGIEGYAPARRGLVATTRLETRAREGVARLEAKLSPAATAQTSPPMNRVR
jgi:tetratricopeptide (TPR) repeat protein